MDTLRDKIRLDNNDSYILFEQGGIGKTRQMKAVFREFATSHEEGMVPVFVDCKTIDFNRKQPLLTHILLKFCGDDCSDNYENSIFRLENMLTKANSKYKYVFFIDGINECENNKCFVVQDIAKLLKSPNNKVIVSSRINEEDIGLKDFKRLRVKEFTDAQIITFLNSKGFKDNGNDVKLDRLNPSLLKILRVPMFLKLFVETYSADNIFPDMYTSNIVRKADLLQEFINKIFDDKNEQHISENDPEYIKRKFALERYLPSLAYEMTLLHKYSINNEVLKNLRTKVFNSNYFERFESEDENIFENILSLKEITNICIKEISLLNKSNDSYAFYHQVWQDFFCGKFYELCIKYDVLESFENAMPESVRQFIGEITGECDFESKDNLDTEASPIEKFLQKHNLQQPENKQLSAIQTRNLVEIMKTSRNGNITGDYSNCNLSQSSFIYSSFSNANFENAIAQINCFFPDGFKNDIQYVAISQNEKEFLVIDKEWYMRVINFKFGAFYEYNIKFTIDINNQKKIEIDKIFTMDDYSFILRLLTEKTKGRIFKNPKVVYILVKGSEINIIGGEQQFVELQAIHQIKEANNYINTNICYGNSVLSTSVELLLGTDYKAIKKNDKIFLYNIILNEFIGIYPIERIGFPRCYAKKRKLLIGFYGANVYIFDFETLKVKTLLGKCQYIGEDFYKNHSCYHLFSDGRLRLLKAENDQYRVIDIIEKLNYEEQITFEKFQDRTINKIIKTWLQEIDILPVNCIGAKFINMQIVDDYKNIIKKEMLIKFYKTVFINGGIIEK